MEQFGLVKVRRRRNLNGNQKPVGGGTEKLNSGEEMKWIGYR